MPLAVGPLNTAQESVALLTVKTVNEFKRGWEPKVLAVSVKEEEGEKMVYSFKVTDPDRHVDEQFNEYLISVALRPGRYKLIEIRPLISAVSVIPMYIPFELQPDSVAYLGHVDAVVRERKDDNDLRAGPVIPLMDQSLAGYSGGPFHVEIVDNYDADLAFFREKYPALGSVIVDRAVLRAWRKPSAEDMK